jgi:hypothetical protein
MDGGLCIDLPPYIHPRGTGSENPHVQKGKSVSDLMSRSGVRSGNFVFFPRNLRGMQWWHTSEHCRQRQTTWRRRRNKDNDKHGTQKERDERKQTSLTTTNPYRPRIPTRKSNNARTVTAHPSPNLQHNYSSALCSRRSYSTYMSFSCPNGWKRTD